jgi:hypothetical protein
MNCLFDLPPAVMTSDTSIAAADAIAPSANRLRTLVYDTLRAAGAEGMTDEELQDATGLQGSCQRPRRVELVARNLVRDSGRTRPTRSGRAATLWVAVGDDRIPTPAPASRDGQARPRDRVREQAGRAAVKQWVKRSDTNSN